MDSKVVIARALSSAFVAGDPTVDDLVLRGSRVLGRRWRWLRPLARRVTEAYAGPTWPRRAAVTRFLLSDRGFSQACARYNLRLANAMTEPPAMRSVGVAESWRVPPIRTVGELADWLGISIGELAWFADLKALGYKRRQERLRHYRYRLLTKRFGQIRVIEAPKPRLKAIQRRILGDILDRIPPHPAAHGFRRERSIKTFAAQHVRKAVVVKMDLVDFFPTISAARVHALFRTAGYPDGVADLLAGLCTSATPADIWTDCAAHGSRQAWQTRWLYSQPHLPQGAPTSPALANLIAYRMDCRLHALARCAGAVYTRYADDLAFSGDDGLSRAANRLRLHVSATVMEEGFCVHHRKTRIMRRGVRQQLTGIVLNERMNVPRRDFDRLKATLTNCIRLGPQTQNRTGHHNFRAHLDGRISFVEMVAPSRGHKLRWLFDQINW